VTSVAEAAALVPQAFRERISLLPAEGGPDGAAWAAELPRLLAGCLDDWGLAPDEPARSGFTAVVLPVSRDGERLALKVVWPHEEAFGEPLALRRWNGQGAVRLVAAEPSRGALLLERLDADRDLTKMWVDEACEVIGGLLARLNVPALPQLPALSQVAAKMSPRLDRAAEQLPRRMVARAKGLAGELASDPGCDGRVLHRDLHFENVLAAEREPWLTIDPKPLNGHPGFELAPVLWNRADELGSGSSFRYLVRQRLELLSEAAGIDEDVARHWTTVRLMWEAVYAAEAGDAERLTAMISLVKAVDS
jgi:streptomycin 6-kinase